MYVLIRDGAVVTFPYSVGKLRADNPNTSFPKNPSNEILEGLGVHTVNSVTKPDYDIRTQKLTQNSAPHLEEGQWYIGWTITDKTADEITAYDTEEAITVRSRRDFLLSQSDWTQMVDSPLSDTDKAAWATYRQGLRDVPSQSGFPNNVTFPTEPT
tara:strand:- start:1 stop:468 length:468 start_codon:yes stop_codon:yes gene_type:complete